MPTWSLICSGVSGPGRSNTGSSGRQSITVDSMPLSHGPPSRIISQAAPRPLATCALLKGLCRRLGLQREQPRDFYPFKQIQRGWMGRDANGECICACRSERCDQAVLRSLQITVIGPGQNASAKRAAALLLCPAARADSIEGKWLISGLNCGLCFAENMRATALASVAIAPNP